MKPCIKNCVASILALILLCPGIASPAFFAEKPKTQEKEKTQILTTTTESFTKFSEKLNIPQEKLESLLSGKTKKDKTLKLIPMRKDNVFMSFWKEIFSHADPKYMELYAYGKLMSEKMSDISFLLKVNKMWDIKKPKETPRVMTFIISLDDELAGEISIGPLKDNKGIMTEIGYVIAQKFSGQGVATCALKTLVNFIKYLNKAEIYDVKALRATAHEKNIASQKAILHSEFVPSSQLIIEFHDKFTREFKLKLK